MGDIDIFRVKMLADDSVSLNLRGFCPKRKICEYNIEEKEREYAH